MIIIDDIEPRVIYTVSELAYYSKMSYRTLYYHIRKGTLKSSKLPGGNQLRIKGKDFLKWALAKVESSL